MGHLVLGRMGNGLFDNILGALVYWAAQFCGMFLAAVVNFAIFVDHDNPSRYDADLDKYGMVCIYATCPNDALTTNMGSMFLDQIMGAAILVTTVFSTTDPYNANPPGMAPLLIGLSATAMGLAFGSNAGGAINSARDFAPRIFASMLYGEVAFTGIKEGPVNNITDVNNSANFMWIPLFGPLVGGAIAALIYTSLVMAHWPEAKAAVEL